MVSAMNLGDLVLCIYVDLYARVSQNLIILAQSDDDDCFRIPQLIIGKAMNILMVEMTDDIARPRRDCELLRRPQDIPVQEALADFTANGPNDTMGLRRLGVLPKLCQRCVIQQHWPTAPEASVLDILPHLDLLVAAWRRKGRGFDTVSGRVGCLLTSTGSCC